MIIEVSIYTEALDYHYTVNEINYKVGRCDGDYYTPPSSEVDRVTIIDYTLDYIFDKDGEEVKEPLIDIKKLLFYYKETIIEYYLENGNGECNIEHKDSKQFQIYLTKNK